MMHHLLTVVPADRIGVLAALAGVSNRSLVFTRTKHASSPGPSTRPTSSRGGWPGWRTRRRTAREPGENVRERNLASFASGAVRVTVATDIGAVALLACGLAPTTGVLIAVAPRRRGGGERRSSRGSRCRPR